MTTRSKVRAFIGGSVQPNSALLNPNYDKAIIGVVEFPMGFFRVAYDLPAVVSVLVSLTGWQREYAEEHIQHCFVSLSLQPNGPIFVDTRFAE